MRIFDRYISGQYLLALGSCTGILMVLYVVIDMFSKISEFMEIEGSGFLLFILSFYACRIPQFLLHLAPVLSLIAATLLVVKLVRQNELVPMIASGTSVHRLFLPVMLLSGVVGIGMAAMEEYLLPQIEEPVRRSKDALEVDEQRDNLILRDDLNHVLVVRRYDPGKRVMQNLVLIQTGDAGGMIQEVNARSARWTDENGGGWLASDGVEFVFDREGKRLAQREFGVDGRLLVTQVTPESMLQRREEGDYLTLAQLRRRVQERPFEANLKVRLHERFTFPLFSPILLGLGLPFVLRRDVRNLFVGGGICMVVCAVFFSTYFFLSDLGSKGELNPVLAAWLPIVIFGGIAIYLLDSVRT